MSEHPHRRRIRATRLEEPEAQISTRMSGLRLFLGVCGEDRVAALSRLLRQERRASRIGSGYDPFRHAALVRLLAETRPSQAIRTGSPGGSHASAVATAKGRRR